MLLPVIAVTVPFAAALLGLALGALLAAGGREDAYRARFAASRREARADVSPDVRVRVSPASSFVPVEQRRDAA